MEMRIYEGMFLLDPAQSQDWEKAKTSVAEMLQKRGAVVLSAEKWGERKLAYEIKKHKRGTYYLVYFQMNPPNIVPLRRDLYLSEVVLRSLILAHPKGFKVPEIKGMPEEGTSAPAEVHAHADHDDRSHE